jgi:hypothetical protein
MILMIYFIQALGASLIAFPVVWFLVGRRQLVGGRERVKVLIAGIVLTACLCIALRYASQLLFGDFIFAKPGGGLNAVFFLGAPLGFAFVVARLMRPLKPAPRPYRSSPSVEPGQGGGEASQDLPIRR